MKRNPLLGLALVVLVLVAAMVWRSTTSDRATGSNGSSDGRNADPPRTAGGPLRARTEVRAIPVQADEDPRGELRLSGLVLDDEELPVEGALVTISTTPPRSVETEADGSFGFDSMPPRAVEILARKDDDVAGPIGVQLAPDLAPITLRMKRASTVSVVVLDAGRRRAIDGASVELRGTSVLEASCDADGRAELRGVAAGNYVVKASAPGYAPAWKPYTAMDSPGTAAEITLELSAGSEVSGRVVDPRGDAVAGARVLVEDASSLVPLTDPRRDSVASDDRGEWSFAALPSGVYRFVAQGEARGAPGVSPLVQLDGKSARRGVVIALPESARLAGRVTTWTGEPVAFATVRAVVDEGSWGQVVARQTLCNKAGEFELKGLPRRRVSVVALGDSSSSLTQVFDLKETPDRAGVVLALDADGVIGGAVRSPSGEPIADAVVLAEPAAAASKTRTELTLRGQLSGVADGKGRFELRGLRPGKYLLRASWPGTSLERRTSWLRGEVVAQTGSREVVLTLEVDGGIKGRVQKEDGSAPERFTVTLGGGLSFSGASGDFVLSEVPPGTHTLRISGTDFVSRTLQSIVVKPREQSDLGVITVLGGRRITGRVLRGDGTAVAGATVTASKQVAGVVAGPAGAVVADAKQVISGEDGSFVLDGLPIVPLSVGAEHSSEGRSDFLTVPGGASRLQLDLTLKAVGSLRGTVTRKGDPVGGAVIALSAKGIPGGGSGVTTGTDGSYQFDSLTPGTYALIAMFDNGGGPQMKQASVAVKPGEVARYDVDLPRGEVTLVVSAAPPAAGETTVEGAQLFLAEARNAGGAAGGGAEDVRSQPLTRSEPGRFADISPGSYQLCVASRSSTQGAPPPGGDPDAGKKPVPHCLFIAVAESPAEQQVSVKLPAN